MVLVHGEPRLYELDEWLLPWGWNSVLVLDMGEEPMLVMTGVGLPGGDLGWGICGCGGGSAETSGYIGLSCFVGVGTEYSEVFIDGLEENSISWL